MVSEVNQDKRLNLINELVWGSFKNYNWEVNNQPDNPLGLGNIVEEGVRFSGDLFGENWLKWQKPLATELCSDLDKSLKVKKVPMEIQSQAQNVWMAVQPYEGQAASTDSRQQMYKSPEETMDEFHDVYTPDWFSVSSSSPLEQFTEADGTQLPDSARLGLQPWSSYDWQKAGIINQWIFQTAS